MYNRDYLTNSSDNSTYSKQEEAYSSSHEQAGAPANLIAFLRSTYQLFASSLLAATAGAYIGLDMVSTISTWFWGLVILEFALLFGLYAVKEKPGINLAVLFAFTFVSGLTITPLLSSVFNMPNGASVVAQAFLMTSVAFGGISMFALTTTKDFSNMGKMLFIALIILVVGSISNIFIGSPILQLGIAMVGALLFSAFILYDTQQIIKGGFSTPIEAAIALYLDFLNLFISLLKFLQHLTTKMTKENLRLLDANLNRLREGIRVVEDIHRYIFNDKNIASQLKQLRHKSRISLHSELLNSRDIQNDVLKTSTTSEQTRADLDSILIANFKRAQESARVLDEFGKLIDTKTSENFKDIRYKLYHLEKSIQ